MDCIVKKQNGEKLKYLYQWDKNQEIVIVLKPENKFTVLSEITNTEAEVHFWTKNSKKADVVSAVIAGNTVTAVIPNTLLTEGADINIFVLLKTGTVENTVAHYSITVIPRIEKEDVTP